MRGVFLGLILSFVVSSFLFIGCKTGDGQKPRDIEWVSIPRGTFTMGLLSVTESPYRWPQQKLRVKNFHITKTEITLAQYNACIDAHVCWKNPSEKGAGCNFLHPDRVNHPVNCVDWYQANTFCAWIDARLPAEAEWEYAARSGGQDVRYPWGNTPLNCDLAVFDGLQKLPCAENQSSTSPVCSKPKGNSAQGVCDLAGNVIEWTFDWMYDNYADTLANNTPPKRVYNADTKAETYHRVMRGGGIGSEEPLNTRNRIYHDPHFAYAGLGFRCVR